MVLVFVSILGLLFGSFFLVLADRIPRGESVLFGRSHCDKCKKPLRWFELIPVFSYIVQGGHCRRCHTRLSILYPLTEMGTAAIFGALYIVFPSLVPFVVMVTLSSILLVLFLIDLRTQLLPDVLVYSGIAVALVRIVLAIPGAPMLTSGIIAALGASGFLGAIWLITRGRGMGFGDVKLGLFLGLLVGYPQIVPAIYLAFLTGAIVGVILMLGHKKTLKSAIAFGPFLIGGTVCMMVAYQYIAPWWHVL